MKNITETIGKNSGKVWQALNKHGILTQTDLIKNTKLTETEFYPTVGWLARENKIAKIGTKYQLGNTNLTSTIGEDAGKIWRFLNTHADCDISFIATMNQITLRDAYSALGWLAREDKIIAVKSKTKNKPISFRIK